MEMRTRMRDVLIDYCPGGDAALAGGSLRPDQSAVLGPPFVGFPFGGGAPIFSSLL